MALVNMYIIYTRLFARKYPDKLVLTHCQFMEEVQVGLLSIGSKEISQSRPCLVMRHGLTRVYVQQHLRVIRLSRSTSLGRFMWAARPNKSDDNMPTKSAQFYGVRCTCLYGRLRICPGRARTRTAAASSTSANMSTSTILMVHSAPPRAIRSGTRCGATAPTHPTAFVTAAVRRRMKGLVVTSLVVKRA